MKTTEKVEKILDMVDDLHAKQEEAGEVWKKTGFSEQYVKIENEILALNAKLADFLFENLKEDGSVNNDTCN